MDGIELMATAMHAAQARLDVSASNLANVSSDGFHKRVARAALTNAGLVTSSTVDPAQGPLRHTGRALDLAATGNGGLLVRDRGNNVVEVRSASFERNAAGQLCDERGRILLGAHGPIVAGADAAIDPRGIVREGGREVGRIRLSPSGSVQSGFLEGSSVDAVHEMVDVLAAQRAFETAQKALSAIDDERQKDVNDVVRIKQ